MTTVFEKKGNKVEPLRHILYLKISSLIKGVIQHQKSLKHKNNKIS